MNRTKISRHWLSELVIQPGKRGGNPSCVESRQQIQGASVDILPRKESRV